MKNTNRFDYKEFMKSKNPRKYIEEKTIEFVSQKMNINESIVRLTIEQSKQITALGRALKYVRQRKRISVKKMAEMLKIKEEDIKNIELGKISELPLGLLITYLNNLGYILNFTITDFRVKK